MQKAKNSQWRPEMSLEEGLGELFQWIEKDSLR